MGNLGLGKGEAPLADRLSTGKATGRLRLLPSDNIEKVLQSPDLVNLKALDLSKCQLKTLPSAIGTKILKLQALKLNDNPELESLPTDLAALKDLRKLDCSNCVRLSSLEVLPKRVEVLELSGCNFEGFIEHPTLPLSVNLSKLDLSNNPKVIGFGPAFGFEILENLTELDLSSTAVEEVPEDIGHLKNLSVLKLEHTKLKSLPRSLFEKTPLSRLELKGTPMTKDEFLQLPGVESFMNRRKERIDRDIAGGVISTDRSICGLD